MNSLAMFDVNLVNRSLRPDRLDLSHTPHHTGTHAVCEQTISFTTHQHAQTKLKCVKGTTSHTSYSRFTAPQSYRERGHTDRGEIAGSEFMLSAEGTRYS
jgi:hypothetical protein